MDFGKLFNSSDFSSYLAWLGYGLISTIILAVFGTVVGLVLGVFLAYGKNMKLKQTDSWIIKTLKTIGMGFCNIY